MAAKLFVLSTNCNPMAELPFFSDTPPPPNFITWSGIVAALDRAKYTFATRRLPRNCSSASEVLFLTLLAAKKAALLYDSGDHCSNTDRYQITYTENHLMNSLPSHVDLKGLPRFHLFESLPEHLQWAIVQRLDFVDYFRLRPLSHQLRRIQYSHPVSKAKTSSRRNCSSTRLSRRNRFIGIASRFLGMASGFCVWAVLLLIVSFEK